MDPEGRARVGRGSNGPRVTTSDAGILTPVTPRTGGAQSHGSLRWRCYEALCKAGRRGLTDYELAELVGRQQNSAGKRRGELCKMGLVRDSGMRRLGPTCSPCIVWVVVE